MSPLGSFLLTLIGAALYAVLHSAMAHPTAKEMLSDWLGWAYDRYYRLFYNVISIVTLLPVLAIPVFQPGLTIYRIPGWLVWLTTLIQLLALLVLAIGLFQTDALRFIGLRQLWVGSAHSQHDDLATDGLYSYARHPLYTAGMVFIWLTPVMTTSLLALNLAFTAYFYLGSVLEEQRLVKRFGEEYQEYRSQVGRFFPRFWESDPAAEADTLDQ